MLEAAGGVPVLRGTTEALAAIAGRTRWETDRETRLSAGPRRPEWPALGADRTPLGHDAGFVPPGAATPIASRVLPERESLELLAAAGLPVIAPRPAIDPDEAVDAADAIGYPVVLKLDATALAHKTEIGGVRLGLAGPGAVRVAAAELLALGRIQAIGLRGLLVEAQATPGVELIVGLRRDPQFGPIVVVGLGGILAEVLDDVAVELAPVSPAIAGAMLDRLRGARVLDGVRGGPALDRRGIVRLIVALAELGWSRSDLLEVDLNPVIAGPGSVLAVDALVVEAARSG